MSEPEIEDQGPPSLDGPLAKLGRAQLHLDELNKGITDFKKAKTYEISTEVDAETEKHISRLHVLTEPDNPAWGLLVGDFAHNLRSALDHLVWQLVRLSGAKPSFANQFPISQSGAGYWAPKRNNAKSMREWMLQGVAAKYRTPIDAVQPYQARDSAHETALAHLSWLNNFDKHRVIHASFVSIQKPAPTDFKVSGGSAQVGVNFGPVEDGAVLMEITPKQSSPDAKVEVEATVRLVIRFGKRGFPPEGFSAIYGWIEWYIKTFEPVFKGEPHPGLARPKKPGESPFVP